MSGKIKIGDETLEIWPAGQSVVSRGHESIRVTQFTDKDLYHRRLIDEILERSKDPTQTHRLPTGLCGEKIFHIADWDIPEARLIDERARAMFRHSVGCDDAIVDISWASLYRQGDYCMPHSHLRTSVSMVYFLDAGYTASPKSLDGRFCFVDPRIEQCCAEEDGRMTTPFLPSATPGTMILFPSPTVHCVNPYFGNVPRISLSWDIDRSRIPGAALPDAPPGT